MSSHKDFLNFHLSKFGFSSKQALIEGLFLNGIIESYSRIDKKIGIENDIRDRFMFDFYKRNHLLKDLLQLKILHVHWERWTFNDATGLSRSDISFELSGLDFIVECKRLKMADGRYIDEGLQRFIDLVYAEGDEYAAMLGFVISANSKEICSELLSKVKQCAYIENEFLKPQYKEWIDSFKSSHTRRDKSCIGVYHLFFDFNHPN
jgi:hypothetical protein